MAASQPCCEADCQSALHHKPNTEQVLVQGTPCWATLGHAVLVALAGHIQHHCRQSCQLGCKRSTQLVLGAKASQLCRPCVMQAEHTHRQGMKLSRMLAACCALLFRAGSTSSWPPVSIFIFSVRSHWLLASQLASAGCSPRASLNACKPTQKLRCGSIPLGCWAA